MGDKSKIEWTDETWNSVRGCTKISPGCTHCYAETLAERFRDVPGHPYEQGFDLKLIPKKLLEPLRWTKARMIFVNSMSDLFHKGGGLIGQAFQAALEMQMQQSNCVGTTCEFSQVNRSEGLRRCVFPVLGFGR